MQTAIRLFASAWAFFPAPRGRGNLKPSAEWNRVSWDWCTAAPPDGGQSLRVRGGNGSIAQSQEGNTERWPSGRRRSPAKRVYRQNSYRGFKSRPLRSSLPPTALLSAFLPLDHNCLRLLS